MGFNHTNLRGLEKVNGKHSLIMLVYNIKRTMNILGVTDLIQRLKNWNSPYKRNDFVLFLGFVLSRNGSTYLSHKS
ncbi:MAG: hypothetical protein IPG85_04360 [Bacteroidetes bacterium]|nr:hypothetical protein [Bacteroidota bacterium]